MRLTRREFAATAAVLAGCSRSSSNTTAPPAPTVVVYTALDQEFSEPLFAPFTETTGIKVLPKFDTEATKTVGLFNTIRVEAEAGNVRCDLFWNNEILNTLRLKQQGLLRPIYPPNADQFPLTFRAVDNTWFGFAARARVLIVNTKLVPDAESLKSIFDLADEKWKGKVGIAKPLFGTTATHAACLFAKLGSDRARRLFLDLKKNDIQILSGNKQVAVNVGNGTLPLGLTDTDDAISELEKGMPVRLVYLDSEPDALGTLFIPNTLAALKNSPNPQAAERLADYLLSAEVETALARGPSAQIPLNQSVEVATRVETPATVRAMEIDWEMAVRKWEETAKFIGEHFTGPTRDYR
jgi:iron(III) transport system substrate-binding protein